MRVAFAARLGTPRGEVPPDRVHFDDLLEQADVLSLHCPLNATTKHMIGAPQLKRMKRDALLINTARGGLIDSEALAHALRSGEIGGARTPTRWPPAGFASVEQADPDFVREHTGFAIGGVAPVGYDDIRTIIDVTLGRYATVWAAAGHSHSAFATTYDELIRITGGQPMDVAERLMPALASRAAWPAGLRPDPPPASRPGASVPTWPRTGTWDGADAGDPQRIAAFWPEAALRARAGLRRPRRRLHRRPRGARAGVGFLRVPEGKIVKNRMHIDMERPASWTWARITPTAGRAGGPAGRGRGAGCARSSTTASSTTW